MLIIYQEDQNHQFIRLGGPNVTIKIQGDQNHGFEKLGGPKTQFMGLQKRVEDGELH